MGPVYENEKFVGKVSRKPSHEKHKANDDVG